MWITRSGLSTQNETWVRLLSLLLRLLNLKSKFINLFSLLSTTKSSFTKASQELWLRIHFSGIPGRSRNLPTRDVAATCRSDPCPLMFVFEINEDLSAWSKAFPGPGTGPLSGPGRVFQIFSGIRVLTGINGSSVYVTISDFSGQRITKRMLCPVLLDLLYRI